jgi:hypothetical protein
MKVFLFLVLICAYSVTGYAHHPFELKVTALSSWEITLEYLKLGFIHVLPLGLDHILFILGIFFLNSNLKSVIVQCSVFTLAHSITLALSVMGHILPDSKVIEPIIALSIVFVALENLFHHQINSWRLLLIFVFGLIHGMGFANALKDIGLPETHFFNSLLAFNIGVELAQIAVILFAYFSVGKWFKNKEWYKKRIVLPISLAISAVAFYWTIERLFF